MIKLRRRPNGNNSDSTQIAPIARALMKAGDPVKTIKLIRSPKTGVLLPREGIIVRTIENLGRQLILVDFGRAGEEYLFPDEIALRSV